MKTVGIICEYNPFHLGHQRQFDLIRHEFGSDTAIICVMSGNYVQRGEPAMWDKFTRANAAIACGADLVLELPLTKVLSSAEGFARGGIEILTRIGCVDILSFGAECGDTAKLMELAHRLNNSTASTAFHDALNRGCSYAAAKQAASGDTDMILSKPNNILGVEYCRALLHYNSTLRPFAIQRNGSYHASFADEKEPSATAVRSLFPSGDWKVYLPTAAVEVFQNAPRYTLHAGERAVLARLRALSDTEWETCAHGSEGLWSKAMKVSRAEYSLEAIANNVKSKRYPLTRINRLLLCAYLGITQQDLALPFTYSRILAASRTGRQLLRQIKDTTNLPLINPGETPEDTKFYRMETRAADLYTLCVEEGPPYCKTEQNARLSFKD